MSQTFAIARTCARQVLQTSAIRTLSTGNVVANKEKEYVVADISHIKKLQQHFQIEDGTPVHLKGGMKDRLAFGLTVFLCATGLVYSGQLIYTMANKVD